MSLIAKSPPCPKRFIANYGHWFFYFAGLGLLCVCIALLTLSAASKKEILFMRG